jgi:hypothetical protein
VAPSSRRRTVRVEIIRLPPARKERVGSRKEKSERLAGAALGSPAPNGLYGNLSTALIVWRKMELAKVNVAHFRLGGEPALKIETYEAVVEKCQVKLAATVQLPEHAKVYVVVPGDTEPSDIEHFHAIDCRMAEVRSE